MVGFVPVTRRGLLAAGSKAALATAAVGIAPRFIRAGRAYAADALVPGMMGGPTGFAGCERYQYGPDTPEARAIEGIKALKGAGKAPAKIVLGLSDGSIGQLAKPFPAGAPAIKDLWEKETGIPIEIVGQPNGQEFTKTMQDIGIRPEDLRLGAAREGTPVRVFEVEPLGGFTVVTLEAAGTLLKALRRGQPRVTADRPVGLAVDPGAVHAFAADGRALAP